jgi:formylglycine-generating enzyme required for sulfatase activity
MKKQIKSAILFAGLMLTNFACSKEEVEPIDNEGTTTTTIEFVTVPTDGVTPEFAIAATEVTYQQYLDFLNEAYTSNFITYTSSDETVRDKSGNIMTSLAGSRVIKDHNKNGIYELEDMENPLNINYIYFNEASQKFEIEDPNTVNWDNYFDITKYPNVVDSKNDWYELSENSSGFYDSKWDNDGQMPTLEEIKTWPANFIRYFGAHAFAEFYGYDLPTKDQWYLAAKGGQNFGYATYNGEGNTDVAVIGSVTPGWPPHKGHVQPVKSLDANPLGIYNLGGNVWEWCKDWYNGPNPLGSPTRPNDADFFVDDTLSPTDGYNNDYFKALLGGSFNYFVATMEIQWNHAALLHAGNDHFGFRVVKNN